MTGAPSAPPASVAANPRLSRWLRVDAEQHCIELKVGKVEIGQGIGTALLQIAADALGVDLPQLRLSAGRTDVCPDEMWTSASISVEVGGASVACVCADLRRRLVARASALLDADPARLSVHRGDVLLDGVSTAHGYWSLSTAIDLDVPCVPPPSAMDALRPGRHVGRPHARVDLVEKLRGGGFVHDIAVPGMLHGRVVRSLRPRATAAWIDRDGLAALPGVSHVVVDGSFVALCGEDEFDVVDAQAKAAQRVRWIGGDVPHSASPTDHLRGSAASVHVATHRSEGEPGAEAEVAVLQASYGRPYLAHASVGTCCALAVPEASGFTVYCHSQGVYPLRDALVQVLGCDSDAVTVVHRDGAGCYGHNGADDVALDALLLARATGRPVRVAWSRQEEMTAAPFGPAMRVDIEAAIAASGRVVRWSQTTASTTHLVRPGWGVGVNLLAAQQLAEPLAHAPPADPPMVPFGGGGERNAVPLYGFARCSVDYRFCTDGPLRTSALRSLGAHANVFAIESAIDEMATKAGLDPLAVRLHNLDDDRSSAVLAHAGRLAGWAPGRPGTGDWGWGIGIARYKNRAAWCAAVVEVELSDRVRVRRVSAAVDCGLAVNPDGVLNQVEGGILQAISWTLKEQVTWDEDGISSTNWDRYPILDFDEVPELRIELVDRPHDPPLGVGECTMGPVSAAIANAVRHAVGARVREMPITADAIEAAIHAATDGD